MFGVAVGTRIHPQDRMARILIVEAESRIAIMLESALNDFGYRVLGPIENPKAAAYLTATEQIDAAVMDTSIDGQIAETVADKLMERGIPFVFTNDRIRIFSLHYSAIPRLQKPLRSTNCNAQLHDSIHLACYATHESTVIFLPRRCGLKRGTKRIDGTSRTAATRR